MPEAVNGVAFSVLAFSIVLGALAMLTSKNVVHAAVWLLGALVATAGIFMLLSAEFLALVQIVVYAGAVSVLMLFVIMLTLRRREDAVRPLDLTWSSAGLAFAFLVLLYVGILGRTPVAVEAPPAVTPDTAAFGTELFVTWMIPFELASLVLLVALVGAVWWAGGGDE